jgi:hypothetical protein
MSGMRPRTKGAVWAAGFLSSSYQGVLIRDAGQPILNLSPPPGRTLHDQRRIVQAATRLNSLPYSKTADPEVRARSSSLRTANELTLSAPEALDLRAETQSTMELYGADPDVPSFARNCVMARRLVERGVRFVHLCHGD